ncbi:hypothetical protein THAOC_33358, partial [Thalassiosira oceanica]
GSSCQIDVPQPPPRAYGPADPGSSAGRAAAGDYWLLLGPPSGGPIADGTSLLGSSLKRQQPRSQALQGVGEVLRSGRRGRRRTVVDVSWSSKTYQLEQTSIGLSRMADDGRAKRLKTSEEGVAVAEVAELRRRNAVLESEIAQLRRGGRREGYHEVLTVVTEVVVTTTVDLSRLDTSLVNQISSFLGTARELLNLALTCKCFGQPTHATALNWSLMEEVARQSVCSRATDAEMGFLPRYASGATTWLSILHRHEHPLLFDVLIGECIEHLNGDKTTVCAAGGGFSISSAVASRHVMSCGAHFAEFQITGSPEIGIVRPMPSLDAGAYQGDFYFIDESRLYPDFLAQRSGNWGNGNVHACACSSNTGLMIWTSWATDDAEWEEWDGMESCDDGDTIGMLLNLDDGTLSVYKNNRRLGVMKDGLSGAYCCSARHPPHSNAHQQRGRGADNAGKEWNLVNQATLWDANLDEGTLAVYKNNRRLAWRG